MQRVPLVAVIGASSAPSEVLSIAQEVGTEIASRVCHLVCGGGLGVMEAACKGFRFGRNELNPIRIQSIGVLPGNKKSEANEYVDIAMPTGIGIARNAIIARMADGIIAVGGGSGTLSEIAYGWQMNKPVVAMTLSGGWSKNLAGAKIDSRREDAVFAASTPQEAMDFLIDHWESLDEQH